MKKVVTKIVVVVLLVGILFGGYVVNKAFTSNTKFQEEEVFVYVPTGSNYEAVKKIIAPYVANQDKIDWVASKRGYMENVKSGKFLLKKGILILCLIPVA